MRATESAAAQDVFVGGEIFGGFGQDTVPFEAGHLYRGGAHDASGDIVLNAEDVFDLGVVYVGPDLLSGRGLDQLGIDADAVAGATNATLKQVARVELAPDLGRRHIPVFELKARRFAADEQIRISTEGGDHFLGDAVTKEILTVIARQVLEREHSHDGAPDQASRRGEARDFDRLRCCSEAE